MSYDLTKQKFTENHSFQAEIGNEAEWAWGAYQWALHERDKAYAEIKKLHDRDHELEAFLRAALAELVERESGECR